MRGKVISGVVVAFLLRAVVSCSEDPPGAPAAAGGFGAAGAGGTGQAGSGTGGALVGGAGGLASGGSGGDAAGQGGSAGVVGGAAGVAGASGGAGTSGSAGTGGGGAGGSGGDMDAGTDGGSDDPPCGVPDPEPACAASDIEGKLRCIPGMSVAAAGAGAFNLTYTQPVDHQDPSKGTFGQRLYLRHVSFDQPTVLATSGYSLSTGSTELNSLVQTNLLQVEHRFFAESVPDGDVPWDLLTIRQSARDFHEIWAALKWIYPRAWVNTGASKGGETSVFYRRFYPCDLQGTVAYVAPIAYGVSDARFVGFVNDVGGSEHAACRQNLKDIQRAALENKANLVGRMNAADYQRLGAEVAFEHSVLEIPFGFWQYKSPTQCASLPAKDASLDDLWTFVSGELDLYADSSIDYYTAYFYAAAAELGAPGVENAHLSDVLDHWDTYVPATYLPDGVRPAFDATAMPDVQAWVSSAGEGIMFIYGSFDPWTAAQYELGSAKDSFKYFVVGGNHGSSIGALAASDKDAAVATLERWFAAPRKISPEELPRELPALELRDRHGRLMPPPRR